MTERNVTPSEGGYDEWLRLIAKDLESLHWWNWYQRRQIRKSERTWRQDEYYRKTWIAEGGNPETRWDRHYIP